MHPLLLNGLGVLGAGVLFGLCVGIWLWVADAVRDFRREVGDTELADTLAKVLAREKAKDAVIEKQNADLDALHQEAAQLRALVQGPVGIYRQ